MIDTNQKQEIEFAAFVGIYWADLKHDSEDDRGMRRFKTGVGGPQAWV